MLKNAPTLAIRGVDTAENELPTVSQKYGVTNRSCTRHPSTKYNLSPRDGRSHLSLEKGCLCPLLVLRDRSQQFPGICTPAINRAAPWSKVSDEGNTSKSSWLERVVRAPRAPLIRRDGREGAQEPGTPDEDVERSSGHRDEASRGVGRELGFL